MKRLLFLLVIALLYCNGINSQSKNDIKKEIQISDISIERSSDGSYIYTIKNKTKHNILVFFTEENNDTLSTIKLLKRKLLRRYGDFSFKMIEWEANMTIENSGAFMPELFVKILSPKEELRIVASFANDKEEQIALKVPKHLLICSEKLFSKRYIGMPYFVENLRMYKFDYPGNEVWFTPYKKYTDKMTT
ncbi:MAG: hypothetical protein MR490_00460 [Prevotella sp.]|nr:hypothetical protein [Prevotella sp.]MCI7197585.1 hypothetical protein [Prevotella sp.]MDY4566879.1 hypothetical protein [Prevotella sp.]